MVREIYGHLTGHASARSFAQQWSAAMEGYRQARNRAGGRVGKLDHYAPQSHDPTLMQRAGKKTAWIRFMMTHLDRTQYLSDGGVPLDDERLRGIVEDMYDTIVTDGVNKMALDAQGVAAEAPAGSGGVNVARALDDRHREIHFKDAESVIAYYRQFSDRALGATFFSQLTRCARDNALVNELGPNPAQTFATLRDTARQKDSLMPGATFARDGKVVGSTRAGLGPDAYLRQMVKNNADFTTLDTVSGALTAALSLGFGYLALAAQALVAGQDPPPPDDWRTLGRAMAVAGGCPGAGSDHQPV